MKVFVCLLVVVVAVVSGSGQVDYSDQANWEGDCPTGEKQSPVDVITPEAETTAEGNVVELSDGANTLVATNTDDESSLKFSFGSTVTYPVPGMSSTTGTVAQLHLHWGAIDTEGSEHLLDGIRYPAEAHLVTSYGDGSKYAVINRFFTIGAANTQIQQMIDSGKASGAEDRQIAEFDLTAVYPESIDKVITYEGGLTTPTCDEVVYWIVVPSPLTISAEQLAELRTVGLGDGTGAALTKNWRDEQELNGRTFTAYESAESGSIGVMASLPLMAALLTLLQL